MTTASLDSLFVGIDVSKQRLDLFVRGVAAD
jgi:hypothetical protein